MHYLIVGFLVMLGNGRHCICATDLRGRARGVEALAGASCDRCNSQVVWAIACCDQNSGLTEASKLRR